MLGHAAYNLTTVPGELRNLIHLFRGFQGYHDERLLCPRLNPAGKVRATTFPQILGSTLRSILSSSEKHIHSTWDLMRDEAIASGSVTLREKILDAKLRL